MPLMIFISGGLPAPFSPEARALRLRAGQSAHRPAPDAGKGLGDAVHFDQIVQRVAPSSARRQRI
jgi:hypothetical protein